MRRRIIAIPLTLAAAAAAASLAVVPGASAAQKGASKRNAPAITRVLPMRLEVGEKLTISGRNFNPVKRKNTIIFRAPSGRTAFAKPSRASRTRMTVVVPGAVTRLLARSSASGVTRPTRFKLRVLNGVFGSYTTRRLSPVILGPSGPGKDGKPGGPGSDPAIVCNKTADHDGDLLPNALELTLKTDPCLKDTDGDGVEDGYEYRSAVDLNDDEFQEPNTSLPYPGKRPFPNPLDPSDANYDFDGDSLTDAEEQLLWYFTIGNGAPRTLTPLTYSAGKLYSVDTIGGDNRRYPALPVAGYDKQVAFLNWASASGYRNVMLKNAPWWPGALMQVYGLLDFDRSGDEVTGAPWYETEYYDFDLDGFVSDDERDEDADGLTNYDETHGRIASGYWAACYQSEKPYGIPYAGTSVIDSDSDGDGVLDGADDQDHDDVPNLMELSRVRASHKDDTNGSTCKPSQSLPAPPATNHPDLYGRVNPFNPCLPLEASRTCTRHPNLAGDGAPFDGSLDWASLN